MKIAIDGPAGAGKSTISKEVAKKLGIIYIDTGAMYRAIGLAAVRSGIDTKDAEGVKSVLDKVDITISHSDGTQKIFLNGENVSEEIRLPEISVAASNVAVIPEVRIKLVELQRFLTASVDERARRRYKELIEKGVKTDFDEVKADMEYRDKNDSGRDFAPLRAADDSITLDNTDITAQEAADEICRLAKERRGEL